MESSFICSPPKPTRTVRLSGAKAFLISPPTSASFGVTTPQIHTPFLISPNFSISSVPRISPPSFSTERSSATSGSSGPDLESCLVDEAIVNIPKVVGEVAVRQQGQSNEISKHQEVLGKLRQALEKAEEKRDDLLEEVGLADRKICAAKEQSALIKNRCKQWKEDIEQEISVTERKTESLQEESNKLERERREYETYIHKMEAHQKLVKDYEKNLPHFQELIQHQEKVKILQQQKADLEACPEEANRILSGAHEKRLAEEINGIKSEQCRLEQQCTNKKIQIKKLQDQREQIKRDTDVLHKRNAAQMIRLKRQLKEVQSRNRQWTEQAAQLENSIQELRKKLDK